MSSHPSEKILVVDDDEDVLRFLEEALSRWGYRIDCASSVEEALKRIQFFHFDLVLMDVRLPGMTGTKAIPRIKKLDPNIEIIVITAFDSKDMALEAIGHGAYDYFTKPFTLEELEIVVRRALEKRRLRAELLREKNHSSKVSKEIIGHSEVAKKMRSFVERVAPLDCAILITGENGTGKSLIAELIHSCSKRAEEPFIKIDCPAIPEELWMRELFGFETQAFPGASAQRSGKFEHANKGTIFLDQVGYMPLAIQANLSSFLEHKQVQKPGGRNSVPLDTRIIASSSHNLSDLITGGRFREDLYQSLNGATIHLPPLRERKEDLPFLAQHFLQEINLRLGTGLCGISTEAMELLRLYHWPGNFRELATKLERGAIHCTRKIFGVAEVCRAFQKSQDEIPSADWKPIKQLSGESRK